MSSAICTQHEASMKILPYLILLALIAVAVSALPEPEGGEAGLMQRLKRSPVKPTRPKKNEGPKYKIPQGPMSLPTFKKVPGSKGGIPNYQGGGK
ncbi:hypothetical protein FOCC_FOCC003930 [Frankliniella occidentalis]|nr:hypothetical protein FOCC_FOCC003930 [Frankliniella occidentalis]